MLEFTPFRPPVMSAAEREVFDPEYPGEIVVDDETGALFGAEDRDGKLVWNKSGAPAGINPGSIALRSENGEVESGNLYPVLLNALTAAFRDAALSISAMREANMRSTRVIENTTYVPIHPNAYEED